MSKVDQKTVALVGDLISQLTTAKSVDERRTAAKDLAGVIKTAGVSSGLTQYGVLDSLKTASEHKKSQQAREGAAFAYGALAESLGHAAEPYLIPQLPAVFALTGDKIADVRTAASSALTAFLALTGRFAVRSIIPHLLEQLTNEKKWQSKVAALQTFESFAQHHADQICASLPAIMPDISTCMWDTKPEVKEAATSAMTKVTATIDNIDIVPFLPALINCINHPEDVPETVYKLAATTFVTQVEAPTLAIMAPLLERGLAERKPAVLRQTSVIIDNMCKLIENPADAHQFLPKLLPGLDRIIDVAADPELRQVASRGRVTLQRVAGGADVQIDDPETVARKAAEAHAEVKASLAAEIKKVAADAVVNNEVAEFVAYQIGSMYETHIFDTPDWQTVTTRYLGPVIGDDKAKTIAKPLLEKYHEMDKARQVNKSVVEEDEGEELCNCEFSLAYGGMILLNNTKLRLHRGQRYGLCGPNGTGKTTLMRAIANGQVEGFPPADVLKTIFVEHNLQADQTELSVLEFILADETLAGRKDETVKMLESVGFDDERLNQNVTSLSGGWKMKLELARAMLQNADILLLDEPTNHLDPKNVQWLVDYLNNIPNVTSMIVSHDSGFLDKVCTNIIHYENRKLKRYKGNLSKFVEQRPEAKAYYELAATEFKFKFPEPGFLEGIKSKDKAILKMARVNFTYEGTTKQILHDITLQCSLNSRVAVIGPNGAGKSTLIKVLTGELVTKEGDVWKHPNLRVAYVAQHAFHHVEQHLDKTPNEYIRWRYQYGEDREALVKANRQLTEEEEAQMKKTINLDGEKRVLEEIQGRRKAKRSYEYEIKWVNVPFEGNSWVSREKLEDWGFAKLVQWFDEKEAAKEGMYQRPLTAVNVEKHLIDVGLPAEFATHSRIRGLSGGQKVKVVLGAAMWNNPHMLVLDEPTNYLDRDSLGALAGAIQEYGGGVVIISHHREFTGQICPEQWNVEAGRLTITGAKQSAIQEKIEQKEQETVMDAFGNVSKVKSTRKLTRKEIKVKEKKIKEKLKAGDPLDSDEEEFQAEYLEKK
ncbi:translational elongation factor EF-1 alpha [Rhizophlyctis rosea]|uniref:Elongation factor 3 n=1 Tax=Rhizophlyctis rosea TaxID=64517 RepID=A0AAD5SIX6_9FUNG|nr:translational elongation factor EF-1 alpha [Rhizophlyctis rosea]